MKKRKQDADKSKQFIIRQVSLILAIMVFSSILGIVRSTSDTIAADTIVTSVGDQFSGKTSKLEMNVVVKAAVTFSDIVSIVAVCIIVILLIRLILDWVPVIKEMIKKYF